MKKRLMTLTMTGMLSMSLLAACGETPAQPAPAEAAPTEAAAETGAEAVTETVTGTDDETPARDQGLVYEGGLILGDASIELALFRSEGEPIAIITDGDALYYGAYTTEDGELEDGTPYSLITVEDHVYGYFFNEDGDGILVDEEGNCTEAYALSEEAAMYLVDLTVNGPAEPMTEEDLLDCFMGGLAASDGDVDIAMALFNGPNEPIAILNVNGSVYYGQYTTADGGMTEDGVSYTILTVGDMQFGYFFDEDGNGILIDEAGDAYAAVALDDAQALELIGMTDFE